jgi:hypothetical protein
MKRPARILLLAAMAAALLMGCDARRRETSSRRIAAPPALLPVLGSASPRPEPVQFVGLEPYERARDLEVLIFSTRSPAFWGVVLPGRWLQLQSPWVQRFDPRILAGVRPDVAASVSDGDGALAVPLSVDGPVMVIRRDLWRETGQPPPATLAALREGVRRLRATNARIRVPVVSDLPEDLLFWGLAWSYEGAPSPKIYSSPKLHALRFMDEFDLRPAAEGSRAGEGLLRGGSAAVLFTTGSRAAAMGGGGSGGAPADLWVGPLPSQSVRAICIYNGWCLASPQGAAEDPSLRRWFLSGLFRERLLRAGLLPSTGEPGGALEGTPAWALGATQLCAPPALDDRAREAVRGAILDATEGPMTAEEALRRAQARLQGEGRP